MILVISLSKYIRSIPAPEASLWDIGSCLCLRISSIVESCLSFKCFSADPFADCCLKAPNASVGVSALRAVRSNSLAAALRSIVLSMPLSECME